MSVPLFTKHLSGEECSLFRSHYFPSVLADHFDFHLRILTAGSNSGGGNRRHSTSYGAATRLRRQRKSRLIIISARRPTYFQRGAGQPACRTTNRSTIVHRHRHRHRHRHPGGRILERRADHQFVLEGPGGRIPRRRAQPGAARTQLPMTSGTFRANEGHPPAAQPRSSSKNGHWPGQLTLLKLLQGFLSCTKDNDRGTEMSPHQVHRRWPTSSAGPVPAVGRWHSTEDNHHQISPACRQVTWVARPSTSAYE